MRNYEKLERENRLIVLPVPIGTTVYEVIPPCRETMTYCPYNGGYGTSRCDGEKHCKAYIEEVPFDVGMYKNRFIHTTRESAEKMVRRLNERR